MCPLNISVKEYAKVKPSLSPFVSLLISTKEENVCASGKTNKGKVKNFHYLCILCNHYLLLLWTKKTTLTHYKQCFTFASFLKDRKEKTLKVYIKTVFGNLLH